jgi:nicotinamidase-related amidase
MSAYCKPDANMKTALLLVDIQNDYFPGGKNELAGSISASLKAKQLLDAFRNLNFPIIHVQHISTRPGATFFLPDTPGMQFHENVKPLPGETIVQKHFPNSFRGTELRETLKNLGVTKLVICGMMTHMCIDSTTRAAFDYGFECIIAGDACATKDLVINEKVLPAEQVHAAFLAAINGTFAQVLITDQAINKIKK